MSLPQLSTTRFSLIPWQNKAEQNIHLKEMMQDVKVMQYVRGYALNDDEVTASFDKMLLNNDVNGLGYWLIYEADICIGMTLLKKCPTDDKSLDYNETGYWIKPAYWGRAIAAEVATRMVKYGFDTLKLPIIVAVADEENIGSIKSLEKAGLTRHGNINAYELDLPFFKIDNPNL
ncbi:MAG: GNAT family N-acetyltransferase [Rhizobiales bacterium]|nr:GNAT family N-acetyltransferase [Hyphomicrobiales bacterium]